MPPGQLSHAAAPASECLPWPHKVHPPYAVPDHRPAGHSVHEVALTFDQEPPLQLSQLELPASANLPASQLVQALAAALENEPLPQLEQFVAPVWE